MYLVSRRRDQAQFVLKNMQIKNVPEKEIEVRQRHATDARRDAPCDADPLSSAPSCLSPPSCVQSYQNEVRLLTELEHPGIVSHVESFIDGDKQHMCIVMGYCEGGDLAAYLKHKKGVAMRETEILYHFVQMALSLQYMHEKSILHRDLKTQNIFIKNGLIQLGDFGISKALTGSNDFAQTCIGTPYVRRGNREHTTRASRGEMSRACLTLSTITAPFLPSSTCPRSCFRTSPTTSSPTCGSVTLACFTLSHTPSLIRCADSPLLPALRPPQALGCVLYEMMTYKHAFDASSINGLAQKILKGQIAQLPTTYPKSMRALVKQMLDLEPKNRPTVAQILGMPFLRKHVRTYVTAVLLNEHCYRPQNVVNFKAQLRRIGLEDLLKSAAPETPISTPPVVPVIPALPIAAAVAAPERASARGGASSAVPTVRDRSNSAAAPSSASARDRDRLAAAAAEKAAAAAARHQEQAECLARLQEEEQARKALEEKLLKLKRAHEQKQRSLLTKKAPPSSTPPPSAGGVSSRVSASKLKPSGSAAKLPAARKPISAPPSSAPSARRPPSASGSSSQRGSTPAAAPSQVPARSGLAEERARRLERERKEHEQAMRLREIAELRAAESARLAEAERIDARRRQVELARRKKSEVESLAIAARDRELEKARADELARQKKAYLAQVAAEQAELERIQLDKQWISKRLDDLASKPSSHARASAPEDTRSSKDRVLADKAAKRDAAIESEQRALLEGRREAFADRVKVAQKAKSVAPHMQSSLGPSTSSARSRADSYDDGEFDADSRVVPEDIVEIDEESDVDAEDDLEQEAQEIEEVEGLVLGLTKRIQDLRTSIQVPAQFEAAHDADEEEEEYAPEEMEESETEEATLTQTQEKEIPEISEDMLQRMKTLAKSGCTHTRASEEESFTVHVLTSLPLLFLFPFFPPCRECAKLVGRNKFIASFEYLKQHLNSTRAEKTSALMDILGKDKIQHWEKIDQLVLMEKANEGM